MNDRQSMLPADYAQWLTVLKQRIAGARQRAVLSANAEQIRLYHDIGREILDRQTRQGWGTKVINRLADDLREAFPEMKGLSASNLKYMRYFAQECPDRQIGQQSADQLPWFHIVTILTKLSEAALREWYNAKPDVCESVLEFAKAYQIPAFRMQISSSTSFAMEREPIS